MRKIESDEESEIGPMREMVNDTKDIIESLKNKNTIYVELDSFVSNLKSTLVKIEEQYEKNKVLDVDINKLNSLHTLYSKLNKIIEVRDSLSSFIYESNKSIDRIKTMTDELEINSNELNKAFPINESLTELVSWLRKQRLLLAELRPITSNIYKMNKNNMLLDENSIKLKDTIDKKQVLIQELIEQNIICPTCNREVTVEELDI